MRPSLVTPVIITIMTAVLFLVRGIPWYVSGIVALGAVANWAFWLRDTWILRRKI